MYHEYLNFMEAETEAEKLAEKCRFLTPDNKRAIADTIDPSIAGVDDKILDLKLELRESNDKLIEINEKIRNHWLNGEKYPEEIIDAIMEIAAY